MHNSIQPMRRAPRNGDEVDVFGPGRQALKSWKRPGATARIKRASSKAERRRSRTDLRAGRY
jgi:hypothetical protein